MIGVGNKMLIGKINNIVIPEHLFLSEDGSYKRVKKYAMSDLSYVTQSAFEENYYSLATDVDYVYSGGDLYIRKYNKSDLSSVAYNTSYGGVVNSLVSNGNYLYAGGITTQKIKRYNLSDLTYVDQSPDFGGLIRSLCILGDYIYAAGAGSYKVRKYALSDLSYVTEASTSYGATINKIVTDGTYLYIAGLTTNSVWKLDPSDLSVVTTSSQFGYHTISDLMIYGDYIYCATYDFVRRLNLSNLSGAIDSGTTSSYLWRLVTDGSYIYTVGTSETIKKFNLSNLSYVTETSSLGNSITQLTV